MSLSYETWSVLGSYTLGCCSVFRSQGIVNAATEPPDLAIWLEHSRADRDNEPTTLNRWTTQLSPGS